MPTTITGTDGVSQVQTGAVESGDLASGAIGSGDLPAGSVIQVVQAVKTDTFVTSANTTYVDITGMSASITPISATSKILVLVYANYSSDANVFPGVRLLRNSTEISIGDSQGSRDQVSFGTGINDATNETIMYTGNIVYLDSPNTTSSVTYKLQAKGRDTFGVFALNRSAADFDDAFSGKRGASSIVLLEIAG